MLEWPGGKRKRPVRTDEVYADELLEHLDATASRQTFSKSSLQNLKVTCAANTELVLVICLDLSQLRHNRWVVDIQPAQTSKCFGSGLMVTLFDEETGSFRKNQHSRDQDNRPGELNRNGDAVAASVHAVFGGIVHDRGDQETDRDSQLVGTNNGTSNPLRGSLRLVQRD